MKVALFGYFFPRSFRAGSATTGIAILLARGQEVSIVTVFAPRGSSLPPGIDPTKIRIVEAWTPDRPLTLLGCLVRMLRTRDKIDRFVFSIYPTAFGRGRAANAVGLLVPSVLARLSSKPVVVFMHSFLETQNVEQLGYRPGGISKIVVGTLERWIVNSTTTLVPLASMKTVVERELGGRVEVVPLPYVESVYSAMRSTPALRRDDWPREGSIRVLLFGTWGPQKDLEGVLRTLGQVTARGLDIQVTIAGDVNPSFPAFAASLEKLVADLPPDRFHRIGHVPEEDVLPLIRSADALILPYHAAGGYSGVMNCAALAATPVIAYDVPQLREFAAQLGLSVQFVPPRDLLALEGSLRWSVSESKLRPSDAATFSARKLQVAADAVERLLKV